MSFRFKRELLAQIAPRYQQATHTQKKDELKDYDTSNTKLRSNVETSA